MLSCLCTLPAADCLLESLVFLSCEMRGRKPLTEPFHEIKPSAVLFFCHVGKRHMESKRLGRVGIWAEAVRFSVQDFPGSFANSFNRVAKVRLAI